jgi:hypothetical protein
LGILLRLLLCWETTRQQLLAKALLVGMLLLLLLLPLRLINNMGQVMSLTATAGRTAQSHCGSATSAAGAAAASPTAALLAHLLCQWGVEHLQHNSSTHHTTPQNAK